MDVDESIQVRCPRCKEKFRDKARRVRDGYSRQCPVCERVLFFSDGSPNQDINHALRQAERIRKLLRQAEDEAAARPAARTAEAEDSEAAEFSGGRPARVIGPNVLSAGIGLPDLKDRIADRIAVAVSESAFDRQMLACRARWRERVDGKRSEAYPQVRADGL